MEPLLIAHNIVRLFNIVHYSFIGIYLASILFAPDNITFPIYETTLLTEGIKHLFNYKIPYSYVERILIYLVIKFISDRYNMLTYYITDYICILVGILLG